MNEECLEARLVGEACGRLKKLLGLLAWAREGVEYKIGARAMARLCEPELRAIGDVRRRVAMAIRMACGDYGIEVSLEGVEGLVPEPAQPSLSGRTGEGAASASSPFLPPGVSQAASRPNTFAANAEVLRL